MPAAALLVAVTVLFAPATPARAERVFTSQAEFANALDTAWIPAPAQPAAVCIVDSGVDLNPDTSNVIARLAVDGGDPGDVSSQKHGTTMAMIATAPYNGWGMVGAAPSVRVVSVRAMTPGNQDTFSPIDVGNAIRTCVLKRSKYSIKVISLSLGGQWAATLDEVSMGLVEDSVDQARRAGVDVVAAAGNHPGPVDWPAAYAPVFSVGASSIAGDRCSFAASGPQVDLWAPGCPLEVALTNGMPATVSGSSGAAAFCAAVLAQLRGAHPDLAAMDAEALVTATARRVDVGPVLNAAAAFNAGGVGESLAQGRAARESMSERPHDVAQPATEPTVPVRTDDLPSSSSRPRLARPRLRSLRIAHGTAIVSLREMPRGAIATIHIYARRRGSAFPGLARTVRTRRDTTRVRVLGKLTELSITYTDPSRRRTASWPLTVRPR